jgi:hypothetical protein
MRCSMERIGNYPATSGGTTSLPVPPLPKLQPGKHLDAVLLAIVQRRKLEAGVMPGVPFN